MHNHPARAAAAGAIILIWCLSGEANLRSEVFTGLYFSISLVLLGYLRSRSRLDFLAPVPGLVVLTFLYAIAAGRYVEEYGFDRSRFPRRRSASQSLLSRLFERTDGAFPGLSGGSHRGPLNGCCPRAGRGSRLPGDVEAGSGAGLADLTLDLR